MITLELVPIACTNSVPPFCWYEERVTLPKPPLKRNTPPVRTIPDWVSEPFGRPPLRSQGPA